MKTQEIKQETVDKENTAIIKEKFNDKIVERNTIDMKIYNVPKSYAIQFKKFADANGMRFNSAMILMLEKLNTMEKLESLEEVIFVNRQLIEELVKEIELLKNNKPKKVEEPEKKQIKVYGAKL